MVALWHMEHASHAKDLGSNLVRKSQTAVSTTKSNFPLSVVCFTVECTRKKNQIAVCRLGRKWIGRSVLQLLLFKTKEVELLLLILLLL